MSTEFLDMDTFDPEAESNPSPTNASCSPYDSHSYAVVAAVSASLAFLSTLLILGVIGIMVLFKKWQYFAQRLVLYVCITAIFVNLGIILHRVDYNNQVSDFYKGFCEFGGYVDQTSNWMLLLSISAIIAHSAMIIFFDKSTERYEAAHIVAIFVFPLFFTWIPFIKDAYGRAGAWCWIRSEERETCDPFEFGRWLQFSIWFLPLYIIMIILMILYVAILVKLRRMRNQAEQVRKKDLLPLIAYPIIYFLLNVFPFINRIYNSNSEDPSLILWYFAALANPSIGAWIALAFTLDPGTRKRLTYAQLQAAAREVFGRQKTVKEYSFGDKEISIETDSYHSTEPPYSSYEACYKLNLGSNRTL